MQAGPNDQPKHGLANGNSTLTRGPSCTSGGPRTERADPGTRVDATARPEPLGVAASQANTSLPPRETWAKPITRSEPLGGSSTLAKEGGRTTVPHGTLFREKVPSSRSVHARVSHPLGHHIVACTGPRPKTAPRRKRQKAKVGPHKPNPTATTDSTPHNPPLTTATPTPQAPRLPQTQRKER